jgi:hypothetical protein
MWETQSIPHESPVVHRLSKREELIALASQGRKYERLGGRFDDALDPASEEVGVALEAVGEMGSPGGEGIGAALPPHASGAGKPE